MGTYNGTVVGTPTWPTALSVSNSRNSTNFGNCYVNTATTPEYISLPVAPGPCDAFASWPFSVRLRFRTATVDNQNRILFWVGSSGSSYPVLLLYVNGSTNVVGGQWGQNTFVSSGVASADGTWHELVFTIWADAYGVNFNLYLDGTRVVTSSALFTNAAVGPVNYATIGQSYVAGGLTTTTEFFGAIDEVVIYNYCLATGSTVTALTTPESATNTGVVALYHLDSNATDAHAALTIGASATGTVLYNSVGATNAGAANGSTPYTYQWHRAKKSGFTPSLGTRVTGQTTTTLTDTTVAPYTTYYYVCQATDSAGGIATSNQLTVNVPAAPLSTPVITLGTYSAAAANLVVSTVTGGVPGYTYQWYRSTSSGFTPGGGNILTGQTALWLHDSTVAASTTYYYKVVASDSQGSPFTATAAQVAVTTPAAPLAIGIPTVGSVSSSSVAITAPAATGGTPAYTYQWYRSQTSGFVPGGGNSLAGKTALALTDTTVAAGTTYFYKCVATDTVPNTVTTTQITVTTPATAAARYPLLIFLAAGDTVQAMGASVPDAVPIGGDYVNLNDGVTLLVDQLGISAPSTMQPGGSAGAAPRIASPRSLPNRLITVNLTIFGGGTDATSVWATWRALEHKLEQAKQAQGPLGKGQPVTLAVRYSTTSTSVNQLAFTFFDVLEGTLTPVDKGVNPSGVYGAVVQLSCLPYGRMTPTTWPASLTYSGTLTNGAPGILYLGPVYPSWVGSGPAVGPIEGTLGSLGQLRFKDVSTAGAINRIRIGRRAINGPSGGMVEADWAGVVNCTNIVPATLLTGQANAVNSDFARVTTTDGYWHDVARASSGTVAATYAPGLYDVFVRVRESAASASIPTGFTAATATISDFGFVLPPDRYTVRVSGNGTGVSSLATAGITVTTAYPWTANIFTDGFETGDDSLWEEVQNQCTYGVGTVTVSSVYALCGTYGLRVTGRVAYPIGTQVVATPWGVVDLGVRRSFTLPDANPLCVSAWMQLNGGANTTDSLALMLIGANVLDYSEQMVDGATLFNWPFTGMICAFGVHAGKFGVLAKGNSAAPMFKAFSGLPSSDLAFPFWVKLVLSPATNAQGGAFTASVTLYSISGVYTASVAGLMTIANTTLVPTNVVPDYVQLGGRMAAASAVWDARFDDCRIWTSATQTELPSQGIQVYANDPNVNLGTVYVQQADFAPIAFTAPTKAPFILDNTLTGNAPDTNLPVSPTPSPSQFRGRFSLLPDNLGIPVNPLYTEPISTVLQGSQWHMLNLGTIPLPPASRTTGLNPTSGNTQGDAGWQLDIQCMSGTGTTSNTLDVDAVWLFPHDEPQMVAEFAGLTNTQALEWIFNSRADGRSECVLRDSGGNILGQANSVGQLLLAAGNQSLVILVERENGVHDVTNTKFTVQLTSTPLVGWFNDSYLAY